MSKRYSVILTVSLMLEKDGKLLMMKRKNTGYMDNMYGFVGGHVEEGETLKDAMVRETKEEAGIYVDAKDLTFVCAVRGPQESNYINLFFRTEKYKGTPDIMEPQKCESLEWFDMDNIPENTIEAEKRAIYNLKHNIVLDEYGF